MDELTQRRWVDPLPVVALAGADRPRPWQPAGGRTARPARHH